MTQTSGSLYSKDFEDDDMVEPRNIEEEIDLVASIAKEGGVFGTNTTKNQTTTLNMFQILLDLNFI